VSEEVIAPNGVTFVQKALAGWYFWYGRRFPWRFKSATNYRLVISEVLLQRTRAEVVAAFYHDFERRYPTWSQLASADQAELETILKPIGLWKRRAASMISLAVDMKKRRGRFPRDRQAIEALPGVGQYVANAILLLVHDQAEPLIDVNMARVIERVFGPRTLVDIRYDTYLQKAARKIVACKTPKEMNWAILDLAALVCFPRNPACNRCPLSRLCLFAKHNRM